MLKFGHIWQLFLEIQRDYTLLSIQQVLLVVLPTIINLISSRSGLVVELWTDNSLPSATVGSNLRQVWCINRSVEETLCYNSNCRTPGPLDKSCIGSAHTEGPA